MSITVRRLNTRILLALLLIIALAPLANAAEQSFQLNPIGTVENDSGKTLIVLDPRYQDGLLRLNDFSHVWVIWWFDQNDTAEQRGILQVHPRRNTQNPLSGVFATRAPVRPNLIGLTLCRVISVQGNILEIDRIDAYDGTPVIDLKPYIPSESIADSKAPSRY